MGLQSSRGERAQSAPVGFALVLAITIIGTVAVVTFGAVALTDTQQQSELLQAEHVMTQFDSQASQVALGDSEAQTLEAGRTGGDYRVDPDAGTLRIVHINFDGGANNDGNDVPDGGSNDDDALIYQTTLGAVVYENGDTTIGYQGGGVWRRDSSGASTMVSPPEFHYRASTLTFPVIRVNQEGGSVDAGSGSPQLTISQEGEPVNLYPTEDNGYPDTDGDSDGYVDANDHGGTDDDADGGAFLNPATQGEVVVVIQSQFYRAWGKYFEQRTDGEVTYDDANQEVTVQLVSTGLTGPFQMPGEGGSIEIRGVDDHSMSDFSIKLVDDQGDHADFSNLQWSMYVQDGDRQFEIHIRHESGSDCSNIVASATIYYSPDDGDANTDDPYQGWKDDDAFSTVCEDTDGDGVDEAVLNIDFVDDDDSDGSVEDKESTDPVFTYTSLSSSDLNGMFSNPNDNVLLTSSSSPAMEPFDGHGASWEPKTYDSGDTEVGDRLFNHYFSELGPGFELTVDDKNSNTVQESLSSGVIEYTGGDRFVTYMHITENDVTVSVD